MKKNVKKYKAEISVIIFCLITYYFLPLFIRDTGSGIFILIIIIPLLMFLYPVITINFMKIKYWHTIIIFLMFLPIIFIYFDGQLDTIIYDLIYSLLFLISTAMGKFLIKK